MSFPADAEHLIIYDKTTKELGHGSFGIVYEGKYQGIDVAVKRILLQKVETSEREENALRRLDHPNVVRSSETEFK